MKSTLEHKHYWIGHDGKRLTVKAICTKCGLVRVHTTVKYDNFVSYYMNGVKLDEQPNCKP